MIVHTKRKLLVLRLRDPNRVLSVIPTAKAFRHAGQELVAVKHGMDEVRVLRNIGIEAPPPILFHYDWPGQFSPFEHQMQTAGFMSMEPRAFNLNGMGTGKTLATLWAYDYLRSIGQVKRALVVTPLSTLERTWADEVFRHFPHLDTSVVYGTREKRMAVLKQDADLYLLNHDGVKIHGLVEAMSKRPDIDLVIIDEVAQVARNASTDRFRALMDICNRQHPRKVWGLTGTPTPNSPLDAWAQCRLLVQKNVPVYFNRFREQVMKQINQFLWVPRVNAIDIVHAAMQPSIRYSLEECIDLPECIYETKSVALTPQQGKAYKDMLSKLCIEAAEGKVTAANEAVKAQKLIQVACGAVYGQDGVEVMLDAGPRIDLVLETIEQAGAKVIVFVPFVAAVLKVLEAVRAAGYSAEAIYGDVSKSARDQILGDFQNNDHPRVVVAQPGTMSHGLNLTAANVIVWYAPINSNDTFQQANARIVRPGQKLTQLVVMIEGTDMERRYYSRLRDKQRVQGILLDMVQDARVSA
jgi:SNF2 family DNA or RNA helicase